MHRTLFLALLLAAGCASAPEPSRERWWKGNLHTHSLWSDGGDFPEMIAAWYRDHGYNFLAVTEHDMLQGGERWVDIHAPDEPAWPPRNASTRAALPGYRARFGAAWVLEKTNNGRQLVRLRGLDEYRQLFEQPDSFVFIMAEEITDKGCAHVNAFNLETAILPRGGQTTAERTRNNIAAVLQQRAATGRAIIPIVNHPNYVWALKAEEIAAIPDARLFEVYNGHSLVNNAGDSVHPGTEQMWDVMLTRRHERGGAPLYGVATDDAHDYREYHNNVSMPGRGWVMVRTERLTPERLLDALSRGDFYASTGVTLQELRNDGRQITLAIVPEANTTYRTQFIGTRRHSDKIGEVLGEAEGVFAAYEFRGDERYVRAKITSSREHIDPISRARLGWQAAWIQPVFR
jgi:hypothetical protein